MSDRRLCHVFAHPFHCFGKSGKNPYPEFFKHESAGKEMFSNLSTEDTSCMVAAKDY